MEECGDFGVDNFSRIVTVHRPLPDVLHDGLLPFVNRFIRAMI
jgi:hypothetical protein